MRTQKKQKLEQLRHWRVRKKVSGTNERPRMSVCFTNEHIYVQFIDDVARVTMAAAATTSRRNAAAVTPSGLRSSRRCSGCRTGLVVIGPSPSG